MADKPILFSGPMVRALLSGSKSQTRRIIKPQPAEIVTSAGHYSNSIDGDTGQWSWLSGDPRDCDTWGFEGDFKLRFVTGDRLYVREHWRTREAYDHLAPHKLVGDEPVLYIADGGITGLPIGDRTSLFGKHRQAMHMPRWASRLTLTVTEVRVQQLQDISEADAIAEGLFWQEPTDEDREWAKGFAEENGGDDEIRGVWTIPGTDCGFGPKPRQPLWGPTAVSAYHALWNSINGAGSWEANPWVCAVSFTVERRNIDD